MADLLEVLDITAHPGVGCMHARARRIEDVYAKWLTTPEAQAALKLLASMMDCACTDVKTVAEYDAVVATAQKDAEASKEGEKVAVPVAFTTAEAAKLVAVKGA